MSRPDLEIDLLRAFVAVAETGGFTAAAEVVRRSQSAVSQKIIRLEELLSCKLFDRTSRSLSLTRDGEQLLAMARRMIELNDVAVRTLTKPAAVGSLRLGITEDFVPLQLPMLLARFRRFYPDVRLELTTGLSCELVEQFDNGNLDAVIAKKDGTAQRGRVIWREPLVWLSERDFTLAANEPIPLVLLPIPCTYRDLMIRSLDAARRDWYASCTASSLMGVQAAVAGGLGVTVLGRYFVHPGMRILPVSASWPALPATEIVVLGEDSAAADLLKPLLSFLTESLSATLEAAA